MNPEHEAVIIREHARLRAEIVDLPKLYATTGEYVKLEDVLGLLFIVENNKPRRQRIDLTID